MIVTGTADMPLVTPPPRGGVDAESKAHAMDLIGEALDVGELEIRLDRIPSATAFTLPAIVDIDVGPSMLIET